MPQPIIFKTRPKLKGRVAFVDAYTSALPELFFLENPTLKKNTPGVNIKLNLFLKKHKIKDCWIFYPQEKTLIRTVNENDYFKLRTARNKNLITEREQAKFRNLS